MKKYNRKTFSPQSVSFFLLTSMTEDKSRSLRLIFAGFFLFLVLVNAIVSIL